MGAGGVKADGELRRVRDDGQVTPPLAGTRVLDLSGRVGAFCTKLLADLGAEVRKVERPSGDRLRNVPPFRDGEAAPESGLLFAYYHHNKRGLTLDWERDRAVPLLAELAAGVDVVVASPFGERDRVAGFVDEPPSLAWVPDGVLTCFITPFGVTGPCRGWRATPFTSFAMSGYMHPVGPPEGPPLAMPGQQLYDEAGTWAAFVVQAVLRGPKEWRAQVIDQSVHEVGLFNKLAKDQYSFSGRIATRATNFGPPPGGVWRCRDGRVDIGAHAPHHWDIFVDLMGRPDTLTDPMYRERRMRIELFDLLTEIIEDLVQRWSARELVDAAQTVGLPCALMQTGAEFVRHEQARGRGFFVTTQIGESEPFEIPGAPFVSAPDLMARGEPAPRLGQDNAAIYIDELGHSGADLRAWQADGLI